MRNSNDCSETAEVINGKIAAITIALILSLSLSKTGDRTQIYIIYRYVENDDVEKQKMRGECR
jgi:hypothetical protein